MKLFNEKNLLKEIYKKFKRVEGPEYKKYFIEIGKKSIEILRKDDTICRIILDEYGADKIEFFDFKTGKYVNFKDEFCSLDFYDSECIRKVIVENGIEYIYEKFKMSNDIVEYYLLNVEDAIFKSLKLSRIDGPASIYTGNNIVTETWFKDGEIYRSDGDAPYIIKNIKTGEILRKVWYENGKAGREGLPACIRYCNGKAVEVAWYRNGVITREKRPAKYLFYPTTKGTYNMLYYKNNEMHREDGPAKIKVDNWKIIKEEYWLNNKLMNEFEYYVTIGTKKEEKV